MNGVDILSIAEVITERAFNWVVFMSIAGLIVAGAAVIGLGIASKSGDWTDFAAALVIGLLIGCFIGVLAGAELGIPVKYSTQYKVTISDEVSMNDFMEKYEIIEQDGRIYTVRERVDE